MTRPINRIFATLALAVAPLLAAPAAAESILVQYTSGAFSSAHVPTANQGVAVFMYHGLDNYFGFNPDSFDVQIDYLAANEFNPITMDELLSWIETGEPALPRRPIVLTFDDNYITVYTVAFPKLKEHGFKGINFAHTYYVGNPVGNPRCDWNQVREMEADGTFLTESHTVMHLHLTSLSAQDLENELVDSKAKIELEIPGKVCRHLAYPYGSHDATVIAATAAAGYDSAVTTVQQLARRTSPVYEIPRYTVNPNSASSGTDLNSQFINAANAVRNLEQPWPAITGGRSVVAGSGASVADWTFTPTETANYEVFARWSAGPDRATDAPFTVHYEGGQDTVAVNQQDDDNAWVLLGSYPFAAGETYRVRLTDDADGRVVAGDIRVDTVTSVSTWLLF